MGCEIIQRFPISGAQLRCDGLGDAGGDADHFATALIGMLDDTAHSLLDIGQRAGLSVPDHENESRPHVHSVVTSRALSLDQLQQARH
jgi:hypothetical protein